MLRTQANGTTLVSVEHKKKICIPSQYMHHTASSQIRLENCGERLGTNLTFVVTPIHPQDIRDDSEFIRSACLITCIAGRL